MVWETAVLKSGFFGAFRPLWSVVHENFSVGHEDYDEDLILQTHDSVKEYAQRCPLEKWPRGKIDSDTFFRYNIFQTLGH